MKDLNRKFEDSWKQAFDGAEIEPSSSVWSNVELDLVRGESDSMKRKVIFYKWLAAASVFLVLFLGGTFYYTSKTADKQLVTTTTQPVENPGLKNDKVLNESSVDKRSSSNSDGNQNSKSNSIANGKSKKDVESNLHLKQPPASLNVLAVSDNQKNDLLKTQITMVNNQPLRTYESLTFESIVEEVPAVVHGKVDLPRLVLPAMPASFMASAKKEESKEDLWASVGVAAGSYNPGNSSQGNGSRLFSSADASQTAYLNNTGYSDQSNVGSAYSAGFAMSKRVFSRWVLQSGVNYTNQSIEYTSNYLAYSASNQSKAFVAEYADFASQSVTITSPYQINSAVEFVSLPLQAGYLLVDRKIGWQMNTGMAADFFVRNTLTDQSGNADRFTQSTGSDSPYRAVSWSGLLGTELSYKVAKQYRVSIVPSMRYSLNSVLKSTSGLSSNPLVMDIGFRFRYIFDK